MEVVQTYASPASTGIYGTPPRRSPAFDVAPEGGLATPPGFKGYTLGAWAENNTAKSSPVTPPPAVAAEAFERAVPMTSIELDTVEHAPVRQVFDEEGAPVCCALLGPFSPFFGGLCLLQTGSSTVLTSGSLAIMRIVQLLTATACAVSGAIISRGTRDASRIIPAAIAAAVGLRRLMLVASFRARRSDPKAIRQRSGYCGCVLVFFTSFQAWATTNHVRFFVQAGWVHCADDRHHRPFLWGHGNVRVYVDSVRIPDWWSTRFRCIPRALDAAERERADGRLGDPDSISVRVYSPRVDYQCVPGGNQCDDFG